MDPYLLDYEIRSPEVVFIAKGHVHLFLRILAIHVVPKNPSFLLYIVAAHPQ